MSEHLHVKSLFGEMLTVIVEAAQFSEKSIEENQNERTSCINIETAVSVLRRKQKGTKIN